MVGRQEGREPCKGEGGVRRGVYRRTSLWASPFLSHHCHTHHTSDPSYGALSLHQAIHSWGSYDSVEFGHCGVLQTHRSRASPPKLPPPQNPVQTGGPQVTHSLQDGVGLRFQASNPWRPAPLQEPTQTHLIRTKDTALPQEIMRDFWKFRNWDQRPILEQKMPPELLSVKKSQGF